MLFAHGENSIRIRSLPMYFCWQGINHGGQFSRFQTLLNGRAPGAKASRLAFQNLSQVQVLTCLTRDGNCDPRCFRRAGN